MTDLDLADRLDRISQRIDLVSSEAYRIVNDLSAIAREIRERGITPAPRRVLDPPLKEILSR